MDEGIMQDATRTVGSSRPCCQQKLRAYTTNGALNTVSSLNGGAAPFLFLFQEIDTLPDSEVGRL